MDRLSSLLNRFRLNVRSTALKDANLAVYCDKGAEQKFLVLTPRQIGMEEFKETALFSLHVDFGDHTNPLRTALPEKVVEHVHPDGDLNNIISLLISEYENARCGAPAVLSRLGEVLVVRILRMQIERGAATPGLLSGLADARISKAIVAIHENPEKQWRSPDLADISGLSDSRFKELFAQTVGDAPMSYLRQWRMVLARIDLERGERVDRVAHRYGYNAPDAFSRAFQKTFGERPRNLGKS